MKLDNVNTLQLIWAPAWFRSMFVPIGEVVSEGDYTGVGVDTGWHNRTLAIKCSLADFMMLDYHRIFPALFKRDTLLEAVCVDGFPLEHHKRYSPLVRVHYATGSTEPKLHRVCSGTIIPWQVVRSLERVTSEVV